jgi:ribosomal-protein-alanine N-acetyltransferase
MLRAWTREDIGKIAEIEKRCFPKGAWTKEQIESSFNGEFFSVLYEQGEILGYLGAVLNAWEAEIVFIAVDSPFRNKGVATKMLDELKKFAIATKREKIFLEVRKSNTSAINLYTKNGFKAYSERKNYYEDEDGICMVFEING